MNSSDERCIARISRPDGAILGCGILISKRLVLTCAHVVESALPLPKNPEKPPTGQVVNVDFPLTYPRNQKTRLSARVLFWSAPQNDVAVLELTSDNHNGTPTRLRVTQDLWEHRYRAFGFPRFSDEGEWNEGIILASNSKGYVQLQSNHVTGLPIEHGFSGTPLWDNQEEAMVGIVAEVFSDLSRKTAYMIPTFTLLDIWPDLVKYIEQPEQAIDVPGPTSVVKQDDVSQAWQVGKKVQIGKTAYIVYQSEEHPSETKYRSSVHRLAKVRLASGGEAKDFWIKQVAFRRESVVVVEQRRLLQQIRDEYKLLCELNDNRQPGFPSAICLDDSNAESAALVFKTNAGRTLAQTYGYTGNDATKTLEGKIVSGQRARLLLQGSRYLCTMLAALHYQGLAHRDLNLESILYTSDNRFGPRLFVRDLGLAAQKPAGGEGHADYAAPEQRRAIDFRDIGPATDVYQVGAVLYHLLSGRPPDKTEIWPPSTYNPDLPFDIDEILIRALDEDCKQRWPKIEEFGAALFDVAGHIH